MDSAIALASFGSDPSASCSLARAVNLGVDIVYVVLGRRGSSEAIDLVNWDSFIRIVTAIDEWLEENEATMPLKNKIELARLFLSKYSLEDEINFEQIAVSLSRVA